MKISKCYIMVMVCWILERKNEIILNYLEQLIIKWIYVSMNFSDFIIIVMIIKTHHLIKNTLKMNFKECLLWWIFKFNFKYFITVQLLLFTWHTKYETFTGITIFFVHPGICRVTNIVFVINTSKWHFHGNVIQHFSFVFGR